mmetsp:Transcript_7806/g.15274  ORF Transcript_7806/g.15274 Transcript_7806/m.15274 type:complete len:144 (+) Transcript_7806:782-1213(+)
MSLGYKLEPSDVAWNWKNVAKIVAVCLLAGVLSGSVGLGGSTIKAPFLHHLLSDASVSKATSTFMLLSTVGASTVIFIWLGSMKWQEALSYMAIGLVGGTCGIWVMKEFMRRFRRKSHIVLFLGAYIGCALLVMSILTILKEI